MTEVPRTRREEIADAAIEVIAGGGMRALTHRAVDARGRLPAGTTSSYLRTRKALILAVVHRLVDLDAADLRAFGLDPEGPLAGRHVDRPLTVEDLDQLAGVIAALLGHWLVAGRARLLARYSCVLETTHDPELREILVHGAGVREQAQQLLTRAGVSDAAVRGADLAAFVDGLLFDRLVRVGTGTGPAHGAEEATQGLCQAIRRALAALATSA